MICICALYRITQASCTNTFSAAVPVAAVGGFEFFSSYKQKYIHNYSFLYAWLYRNAHILTGAAGLKLLQTFPSFDVITL